MLIILIIAALIVIGVLYTYSQPDYLADYKDILGLQKAALASSAQLEELQSIFIPLRSSVFSKYEPVVWLYTNNNAELLMTSNRRGDLRIWIKANTNLKDFHLVLDCTSNDNTTSSNFIGKDLPLQQIDLEGDFPKYFNLYCTSGKQIIALQIAAPNIMAYIIDNALNSDIEIIDNHVAIIVRKGAKNISNIKKSIELAQQINILANAVSKITKD